MSSSVLELWSLPFCPLSLQLSHWIENLQKFRVLGWSRQVGVSNRCLLSTCLLLIKWWWSAFLEIGQNICLSKQSCRYEHLSILLSDLLWKKETKKRKDEGKSKYKVRINRTWEDRKGMIHRYLWSPKSMQCPLLPWAVQFSKFLIPSRVFFSSKRCSEVIKSFINCVIDLIEMDTEHFDVCPSSKCSFPHKALLEHSDWFRTAVPVDGLPALHWRSLLHLNNLEWIGPLNCTKACSLVLRSTLEAFSLFSCVSVAHWTQPKKLLEVISCENSLKGFGPICSP